MVMKNIGLIALITKAASTILILISVLTVASCGKNEPSSTANSSALTTLQEKDSVVDSAELERLRALGYVDVVDLPPERLSKLGVLKRDETQIAQGLTFFTNALNCSAMLIDSMGIIQNSWQISPCHKWDNSVLLPNGDIITIHYNPIEKDNANTTRNVRELIRLSWDGAIRWRQQLPVHHDLDVLPDSQLATMTFGYRVIPRFHAEIPVRDHWIQICDTVGKPMEQASITDLLSSNPEAFSFQSVAPSRRYGLAEIDLLHPNSIEWMRNPELSKRKPLYSSTNFLVAIRHQDVVAIFNWKTRRLIWAWGQGILSGPHDATLIDNGNILVFDNGLGRKWSRVLEINPITEEIVWHYTAKSRKEFFSLSRGAAQRLQNGNTLITESTKGRVLEVTPAGKIVWEFLNPNLSKNGKPLAIVRTRRVEQIGDQPIRFSRSD